VFPEGETSNRPYRRENRDLSATFRAAAGPHFGDRVRRFRERKLFLHKFPDRGAAKKNRGRSLGRTPPHNDESRWSWAGLFWAHGGGGPWDPFHFLVGGGAPTGAEWVIEAPLPGEVCRRDVPTGALRCGGLIVGSFKTWCFVLRAMGILVPAAEKKTSGPLGGPGAMLRGSQLTGPGPALTPNRSQVWLRTFGIRRCIGFTAGGGPPQKTRSKPPGRGLRWPAPDYAMGFGIGRGEWRVAAYGAQARASAFIYFPLEREQTPRLPTAAAGPAPACARPPWSSCLAVLPLCCSRAVGAAMPGEEMKTGFESDVVVGVGRPSGWSRDACPSPRGRRRDSTFLEDQGSPAEGGGGRGGGGGPGGWRLDSTQHATPRACRP